MKYKALTRSLKHIEIGGPDIEHPSSSLGCECGSNQARPLSRVPRGTLRQSNASKLRARIDERQAIQKEDNISAQITRVEVVHIVFVEDVALSVVIVGPRVVNLPCGSDGVLLSKGGAT